MLTTSRIGMAARVALCVALGVACLRAPAATIYETADPFGGFFGLWGYDVFALQSVGLRFTPDKAYNLDEVALWFMSNDWDGTNPAQVTITLRNDKVVNGNSTPGDVVYEQWQFTISAVGWAPALEHMASTQHPLLLGGVNYWIVAESPATGDNAVWNIAGTGTGFVANTDLGGDWYPGGTGAVVCTIVKGRVAGDINGDGSVDQSDLGLLLAAFGTCEGDRDYNRAADIDGDGCVGQSDLGLLLANFGS